jgi:hypothetical protein
MLNSFRYFYKNISKVIFLCKSTPVAFRVYKKLPQKMKAIRKQYQIEIFVILKKNLGQVFQDYETKMKLEMELH